MMAFILWPTVVVAMIVGLALLVGELWWRRLLIDVGGLERLSWDLFLGVGMLATASWIGVLTRLGPWGGVLLLGLASAPRLVAQRRELARRLVATAAEVRRWAGQQRAVATAAVMVAAAVFAVSWYPPTGFDDATYHLPWVEVLVRADGELFQDRLRFPAFPLFAESVWALGVAIAGDRAAQGLSVVATFGTAGLLWAWASRQVSGWWRVLPALWWLGHPIVIRYSATAYVEPWLAWATVAALAAADRARTSGLSIWWWIAGAAAGWAVATKYLGVLVAVAVFAAALASRRLRVVLRVLTAGTLAAGGWIAVVVALTGNPLFPFAAGVFGRTAWVVDGGGGHSDWSRALTWMWDVVVARANVGWQPPYSPLVLLFVPAALLLGRNEAARNAPTLLYAALAVATFPLVPRDSRYLLPMVAVAGIWLVVATCRWSPRRGIGLGLAWLLLTLPGPAYLGWHALRLGALPLSAAAEHELLGRQYPRYGAIAAIERLTPPDTVVYAFGAQNLRHHLERDMLGEVNGPFSYRLVTRFGSDVDAVDRVLCGFGADLVMVPAGVSPSLIPLLPEWKLLYHDAEAAVLWLRCGDRGRRNPR